LVRLLGRLKSSKATGHRTLQGATIAAENMVRNNGHRANFGDTVLAGKTYVWQAFPSQLLERLVAQDKPHTKLLLDYSPNRLKHWLQDEIDTYCKTNADVKPFSAHAFRKRAMTEAWRRHIPPENAAIAFGCNVRTMMAHYVLLDEAVTSDEVFTTMAETIKTPIGKQA
jgi:hypothetical protein